MNLVDAYVTRVLSEPYKGFNLWWVVVEYSSWGRLSETYLMFNSEQEALNCKEGYHFLT